MSPARTGGRRHSQRRGGAPDARQLRTILIAVSIALMAVIASVSGLNVAQTHMAVEFGASHDTVLWIINIYTLALAALLLPRGAIGDRLGRKPMLIAGLGIFRCRKRRGGPGPDRRGHIAEGVRHGVSPSEITMTCWSTIGRQPGARGGKTALDVVEVSVDDGRTWQRVRPRKKGDRWVVTVRNPERGFVSLRANASDIAGNTVTETIVRAYRVR